MRRCCRSTSRRVSSCLIICIRTPTYHILPANTPDLFSTPLASLSDLPIPAYTSPVPQRPQDTQSHEIPFIPGGGLTRRILSSLPSPWPIPTAALLRFVMEGDNRADAKLFAMVVAKLLGVDTVINKWKEPRSWEQGLFGPPHDQTLYG
jgi:proteasome assembly chaperone 2